MGGNLCEKSHDQDVNWRDYRMAAVKAVSRNFIRGKVTRTLLNFKGAVAKKWTCRRDGIPQVGCLE